MQRCHLLQVAPVQVVLLAFTNMLSVCGSAVRVHAGHRACKEMLSTASRPLAWGNPPLDFAAPVTPGSLTTATSPKVHEQIAPPEPSPNSLRSPPPPPHVDLFHTPPFTITVVALSLPHTCVPRPAVPRQPRRKLGYCEHTGLLRIPASKPSTVNGARSLSEVAPVQACMRTRRQKRRVRGYAYALITHSQHIYHM